MSYDDDGTYANGANGSCHECGGPTDEPHHVLCADCYAEENGWRRPDRAALEVQHDDRERLSLLRVVELLGSMERRLEELHERLVALERGAEGGGMIADTATLIEDTIVEIESIADLLAELGDVLDDPSAVRRLRTEIGVAIGELTQGAGHLLAELRRLERERRAAA